ncbi:MAG TPA: hypothetical protein VFE15_10700 [Marmoricola sp.]|nr:hypothetical protein [Marmoricola sp.]
MNLKSPNSRRLAAVMVGLALAGTAACGGSSAGKSAPTDASKTSFCKVLQSLDLSNPESGSKALAKVGTPKGIPDDARSGFEILVDKANQKSISASDKDKVTKFLTYVTSACG